MNPLIELDVASTPDEVAARAAARATEWLRTQPGEVTLALSGGSTPKRFHAALLAQAPTPPWDRTHILWSDERALPSEHADRNDTMAQQTLLDPLGLPAERVHRPDAGAEDLDAAAERYAAVLRGLAGEPPKVDLVILGMGTDGHTASLFPGVKVDPFLSVAAVDAPPDTPARRRLTFTYGTLRYARRVLVLVTGADKADPLAHALSGPGELPLQRVLHERAEPTWVFADRAAAGRAEEPR